MLVLRRRAGESLLIGDDIEIEVLELTPQGAKIGIRAPRETIVLRKELKITQEQNARAARSLASQDFHRALEKFSPKPQDSLPAPISTVRTERGARPTHREA